MAVATSRTARYGGAVATITTAASPGAALTTLFNSIDTALTTAGWTKIKNTGSPGPNVYTSPGESGTENLFLIMTTGAYGTASGVEMSGGSWICFQMCQWADLNGNYCNGMGGPKLATSATQSAGINCLSLTASTTFEYAFICDLDGLAIFATTSATPTQNRWAWTGISRRLPTARPQLKTTGTVANGSNVVISVNSDPTAAGYQVGDTLTLLGQQVGGVTATLGDAVGLRVAALSSTTITAAKISGLSQTLSAGALIGDSPQPYYGTRFNQGAGGDIFGVSSTLACQSPSPGFVGGLPDQVNGVSQNLWALMCSSNGAGGCSGSTDGATIATNLAQNPCSGLNALQAPTGLATTGTEPRSGASAIIRAAQVTTQNNGPFSNEMMTYSKYVFSDQRTTSFATGTLGRRVGTNEEYVACQISTVRGIWLGPFPKTSPTVTVLLQNASDQCNGDMIMVQDYGDILDIPLGLITDRAYPNDYVSPTPPTNAINQGLS